MAGERISIISGSRLSQGNQYKFCMGSPTRNKLPAPYRPCVYITLRNMICFPDVTGIPPHGDGRSFLVYDDFDLLLKGSFDLSLVLVVVVIVQVLKESRK